MRRPRGFTVLEALIATVILLLGFLAVAAVFPASYRGAALSQNRTTALRVAQNVLETVRTLPFGAPLPNGFPAAVTLAGEVEGGATSIKFTPTVAVTPLEVVNAGVGNGAPLFSSEVAVVTVQWREGTGPSSVGVDKTLVLQGGISRDP